jgi:hypothetical protein
VRDNSPLCNYFSEFVKAIAAFSYAVTPSGELTLNGIPDPQQDKTLFKKYALSKVAPFVNPNGFPLNDSLKMGTDTQIFPTLQMGVFGLLQDEQVLSYLLGNAEPGLNCNCC